MRRVENSAHLLAEKETHGNGYAKQAEQSKKQTESSVFLYALCV